MSKSAVDRRDRLVPIKLREERLEVFRAVALVFTGPLLGHVFTHLSGFTLFTGKAVLTAYQSFNSGIAAVFLTVF